MPAGPDNPAAARTIVDVPGPPPPHAAAGDDGRTLVDAPGDFATPVAGSAGLLGGSTVEAGAAGMPYVVRRPIARGGVGELHLAQKPGARQWFVIKRLLPEFRHHPHFLERFEEECDIADLLAHDTIVRYRDRGADEAGPYAVFNFVEGPFAPSAGDDWGGVRPPLSLQEWVDTHGPRPAGEVVPFFRGLCGAIGLMNRKQVVHRDIKPANVLVRRAGAGDDSGYDAVLADFGLARCLTTAGKDPITPVGATIGTPGYMAPEQQTDPRTVDFRADLYSLGATLHFALTGRPPGGARPGDTAGVPLELQELCRALLEKDRERRLQHVEDADRRLAAIEAKLLPAGRVGAAATDVAAYDSCVVCAAVQESAAAEFCRKCGADLFWFCPKCFNKSHAGDRFCGRCRCDGYATRDAVLAQAELLGRTLPTMVQEKRYADALRGVAAVARFRHPATSTPRAWAKRAAVQLRKRLRAERARRGERVRTSDQQAAAHQYREAYLTLSQVPKDLQTPRLREQLTHLAALTTTLQRLSTHINAARKTPRPYEHLAELDEYLRLVPSDGAGQALRADWQQMHDRAADAEWQKVRASRSVDALLAYAERFKTSPHAAAAGQTAGGLLREELLAGGDASVRQIYLRWRGPEQLARDVAHARTGNTIGLAGVGLVAGVTAGFVLGAFFSFWVWLALGAVAGAVAAGVATQRDAIGPGGGPTP